MTASDAQIRKRDHHVLQTSGRECAHIHRVPQMRQARQLHQWRAAEEMSVLQDPYV